MVNSDCSYSIQFSDKTFLNESNFLTMPLIGWQYSTSQSKPVLDKSAQGAGVYLTLAEVTG